MLLKCYLLHLTATSPRTRTWFSFTYCRWLVPYKILAKHARSPLHYWGSPCSHSPSWFVGIASYLACTAYWGNSGPARKEEKWKSHRYQLKLRIPLAGDGTFQKAKAPFHPSCLVLAGQLASPLCPSKKWAETGWAVQGHLLWEGLHQVNPKLRSNAGASGGSIFPPRSRI